MLVVNEYQLRTIKILTYRTEVVTKWLLLWLFFKKTKSWAVGSKPR